MIHSPAFEKLRMEVLNRVTPGLRHKMFGKLQPISLLSQVLSKKLDTGAVDPAYVQTQVNEIKLNSRLLTTATQNLFSWIAFDDATQLPADELVAECVELLKMECYSSHLVVLNRVTSHEMLPAMEARIALCASILLLADQECEEKELEITAVDHSLNLQWNEACSDLRGRNGILNNWNWIEDMPTCQATLHPAGISFYFPSLS